MYLFSPLYFLQMSQMKEQLGGVVTNLGLLPKKKNFFLTPSLSRYFHNLHFSLILFLTCNLCWVCIRPCLLPLERCLFVFRPSCVCSNVASVCNASFPKFTSYKFNLGFVVVFAFVFYTLYLVSYLYLLLYFAS